MMTFLEQPVLSALQYYDFLESDVKGDNVNIHCPFPDHEDSRPSLSVHVFSGLWKCHGCDRQGNYKQLVHALESRILGYDADPWEMQLAFAGIDLGFTAQEQRVVSLQKNTYRTAKRDERALFLSYEFFYGLKKPNWDAIQHHYLFERGFSRAILKAFDVRINHTSEHSIVIPVFQQGVYLGYTARKAHDCAKDEAKYWHSPGMHKSEIVFGDLKPGPILLVEGPLDKIMAHQLGFDNVACTFGWALSKVQAEHIKKYATKIIDGQDNDERGEEGARKSRELIQNIPHERFVYPQKIKDIGSMYQQQQHFTMYTSLAS